MTPDGLLCPARGAGAGPGTPGGGGAGGEGEVDEVAKEDAANCSLSEHGLHPSPEIGRDHAGAVGECKDPFRILSLRGAVSDGPKNVALVA